MELRRNHHLLQQPKLDPVRAVSLFSNCGAGDIGYASAGFHFDVMAEIDERRLEVGLLNHEKAIGITGDLRSTWKCVIRAFRSIAGTSDLALLAACPPCQGMSTARSKRGLERDPDAGSSDQRNLLIVVVSDVAVALRPYIVVLENVPAFFTRQVRHPESNSPISAANLLIELLRPYYQVFPLLTDLNDYGIPQTRKRAFLTFIRRDLQINEYLLSFHRAPYPRPTHSLEYGGSNPVTIGEFLRDRQLPSLDASNKQLAQVFGYKGLHQVPVLDQDRYLMVAAIPPNSGGSAWQNDLCRHCGSISPDPDAAICSDCKEPLSRPVVKEKDGEYRLVRGFRSTSYRRMSPEKPAPTITTASGNLGSSTTIHPHENRVLSPLECALLQTIPHDFDWGRTPVDPGLSLVRKMIGEAVPPTFTALHGRILMDLINQELTLPAISMSDERCIYARERLMGPPITASREFSRSETSPL